jgi:acyl-CoA thioester hydrolase
MSHPAALPAPLYQGSVNTWECDEGGHMNVRFHAERALIGLAHMARALDLPRAFTPAAGSTIVVNQMHIRFLQEARPGAPLVMHGGVVALGESDGVFCLDMRHGDGAPSSAFTLHVTHVDTRGFRPFAWSERSRDAAKRLSAHLPAHAKPRSIDMEQAPADANLARAVELGAARIGGTLVQPDQCDAFGRLRGEHFIGRVSDSVPNLLGQWRREAAADKGGTMAGAVVEARLVFRRFPRAGDFIEVRTGLADITGKTLRLVHWICDPVSGAAWATMEAIALTFDTTTRKAVAYSDEMRERWMKNAIAMTV